MNRPKRPSGTAAMNICEPLLKKLFALYDLRGDGEIQVDEFDSTQSLVQSLMKHSDMQSDSGRSSLTCQVPISTFGIAGRSMSRGSVGSTSASEALPTIVKSPSLAKYAEGNFKSLGADEPGGLTFDGFIQWQRRLLDASNKSTMAKVHRLNWLIDEITKVDSQTRRSQIWRQRETALRMLEGKAADVSRLTAEGNLALAIATILATLRQVEALVAEEAKVTCAGARSLRRAVEKLRSQLVDLRKQELRKAMEDGSLKSDALEKFLDDSTQILSPRELEPIRQRLAQMREPFALNVSTLAAGTLTVEISLRELVSDLRSKVAAQLGVRPYRVQLAYEGGPLKQDNLVLEDVGVGRATMQLAAVLLGADKWIEASVEEICELLVATGLDSKTHVEQLKAELENGELKEDSFRTIYVHRLKEAERREEERKEQAEAAERVRLMRERAAAERRQKVVAEVQALIAQSIGNSVDFLQGQLAELTAKRDSILANALELRNGIQSDLDTCLPQLHEAFRDLDKLRKADLEEVRSFRAPPPGRSLPYDALCIMFDVKPSIRRTDGVEDYFTVFKKCLLYDNNLLMRMKQYDKDNIPAEIIRRITPYIEDERFTPDANRQCSYFGAAIVKWVRAMYTYHSVAERVSPLRPVLATQYEELEDLNLQVEMLSGAISEKA